jgi:predicted XRE-type DNA-binding protein
MTTHYRWETTLEHRRARDPGIDAPNRRKDAQVARGAFVLGHHLAEMRKERGLTQQEVAAAMGVSQVRVSRMENGELDRMQVDSIAAYVSALGGHLKLVADFGDTSSTVGEYPGQLSA